MSTILVTTQDSDKSVENINKVIKEQLNFYQEIGASIEELEQSISNLNNRADKWQCNC